MDILKRILDCRQMNITNYAIILNLTIVLTIASSCTKWIKREDYYTGNVLICCSTSCKPGFFVSVCPTNGTDDKCVPCPEGTYMDDATNSALPQRCIPHECLPNSVPADSFPLKGCRKKCRCDVINGYTGIDPCDCQKTTTIKDVFSGSSSRKLYTSWNGGSREVSRNVPTYTTTDSTTLKNDNRLSDGSVPFHKSDSGILTICIVSPGLGGLILVLIAVWCIKRRTHQKSEHTLLTTEQPNSQTFQRPVASVRPIRSPINTEAQNDTALNGRLPLILGAETNNESTSPPQNRNGLIHPNSANGLPPDNSYDGYLGPAPTIDPSSLGDDQIQLESNLGEHQIHLDSWLGEDQIQLDSYPSAPLNDLNFTHIDYQLQT